MLQSDFSRLSGGTTLDNDEYDGGLQGRDMSATA